MNRRTVGRGRLIVAVGAVVTLIGCFLPWYTVGGEALPARSSTAFDGAGIIVFVASIALLALIALPYAAGDQPIWVDRARFFAVVVLIGVTGLVMRTVQLASLGALGLPDRALGLWLAGIGLAVAAWGVAEIVAEPPRA